MLRWGTYINSRSSLYSAFPPFLSDSVRQHSTALRENSGVEEMVCNLLLSWTLLLLSIGPLLAHPISETADMSYIGPDIAEDAGAVDSEDLDLSSFLQRTASFSYSPLLSKDSLRVSELIPKEIIKEVLLNKPGHLNSLNHILGIKRPYRKRSNSADCFWKYCV